MSQMASLSDLLSGGGRGAVVAGAAGVGKTRLAQEAVELASGMGFATAWVTASWAAQCVPFGALTPLLPNTADGPDRAPVEWSELLRTYLAALAERGAGRPLALFVDDAHLLDDLSATLVFQAAAAGFAFVVVTVRTGEPIPDPVTALWSEGVAARLELRGLGNDAITDVLSAVLGGHVDPASAAYLAVHCQGNMLFLRELVIGAGEDGTLADDGGVWRLTGPLAPSARLVELVEARLQTLSAAERELMELVAHSEPLGSAGLDALAQPGTVESLERRHLLVCGTDGRRLEVRLTHPTFGDVLRDAIPTSRLRSMSRRLAEVIETHGNRRRDDTLRVAVWRLDGGGASPQLMHDAAVSARWRHNFRLAARLGRAAVAAGGGFDSALLLAQLEGLDGRASVAAQQLAGLAAEAADDSQRARVVVAQLENFLLSSGNSPAAMEMADVVVATTSDPQWRDEVAARRASLVLSTMGPRAAAEATGALLDGSRDAPMWALLTAGFSLARLGRTNEALTISERGYVAQATEATNREGDALLHLFVRCEAFVQSGRLAEAETTALEQYRRAIRDGHINTQALFALQLARSVSLRGDVQTAARRAREAAVLFRDVGREGLVRSSLVHAALALALAGRGEEAAQILGEFDEMEVHPALWTGTDLLETRGWIAVAQGDRQRGLQFLRDAAQLGERTGDLVGQASALHGLARLGQPAEGVRGLDGLARTIEGVLTPVQAAHARALIARDPAGLDEVASQFDALGATLPAAEAAAAAAAAWDRDGESVKAAAAERRVAELLGRCEGPRTPELRKGRGRNVLTPAEWDTALLAARGRPSKEIAAELCLSVRTIENRLQRIYDKLGVTGRGDLAAILE